VQSGQYARLCHVFQFFYVLISFNDHLTEQLSQDPLDRLTQSFDLMKVFWVQMIDLDLFCDISRDVAMVTNFVKKWQTRLIRFSGNPKRNG